MKKFFSCFLASLMCVFSGAEYVFAWGVNRKIVFSDGTELLYVASDDKSIEAAIKYFDKKIEKAKKKSFTLKENLLYKTLTLGASALCAFLALRNANGDNDSNDNSNSDFAYWLEILGCVVSGIASFYPEYVNHKVNYELNGEPRSAFLFDDTITGLNNFKSWLEIFRRACERVRRTGEYLNWEKNGLLVVYRPNYNVHSNDEWPRLTAQPRAQGIINDLIRIENLKIVEDADLIISDDADL